MLKKTKKINKPAGVYRRFCSVDFIYRSEHQSQDGKHCSHRKYIENRIHDVEKHASEKVFLMRLGKGENTL